MTASQSQVLSPVCPCCLAEASGSSPGVGFGQQDTCLEKQEDLCWRGWRQSLVQVTLADRRELGGFGGQEAVPQPGSVQQLGSVNNSGYF